MPMNTNYAPLFADLFAEFVQKLIQLKHILLKLINEDWETGKAYIYIYIYFSQILDYA
jgi:hypothetical protein